MTKIVILILLIIVIVTGPVILLTRQQPIHTAWLTNDQGVPCTCILGLYPGGSFSDAKHTLINHPGLPWDNLTWQQRDNILFLNNNNFVLQVTSNDNTTIDSLILNLNIHAPSVALTLGDSINVLG